MRTLLSVFACGLLALEAFAGEPARWVQKSIDTGEGGKVDAVELQTESYRFRFIPPKNFQLRVDAVTKTALLYGQKSSASMKVQITTNSPGVLPSESLLRKQVLDQYPGGAILQTISCPTGSGSGRAVDVLRVTESGERWTVREIFLPFKAGRVEFTLTSRSADFEKQRWSFGVLLDSFCVEDAASN